jgi:short-subunit dehydrogenase
MNTNAMPPRPWALVTGASAGIGAQFARELAARGWNLALTARRAERLHALAGELERAHGIRCHAMALDLADPEAPRRLHESTEAAGIAIEMLVNNAGYGVPGSLVSQPWPVHRDFIEVLVTAPVALSWQYLPGMQQRGRGFIINIASLAGHMPGSAGHTLYAASKAWLIKFSQSLALENRARGIHVTAVCPGFTYSEFHDVNGARGIVSKLPKWMWMQADEVVRQGVDAALRGDVVYVNGKVNRLIKFIGKHLPDGLALRLMAKRSKDYRVQDADLR